MLQDVTEKVIEDIFSSDKLLLAKILSVNPGDLNQIARQKRFDSGKKLDLLYMQGNELLLIELKAVPFYQDIIQQINYYYSELLKLQEQLKKTWEEFDNILRDRMLYEIIMPEIEKAQLSAVKTAFEELEIENGIKWMQEGNKKEKRGFTDGFNSALSAIRQKKKEIIKSLDQNPNRCGFCQQFKASCRCD